MFSLSPMNRRVPRSCPFSPIKIFSAAMSSSPPLNSKVMSLVTPSWLYPIYQLWTDGCPDLAPFSLIRTPFTVMSSSPPLNSRVKSLVTPCRLCPDFTSEPMGAQTSLPQSNKDFFCFYVQYATSEQQGYESNDSPVMSSLSPLNHGWPDLTLLVQ